jgi:hypothetical protein
MGVMEGGSIYTRTGGAIYAVKREEEDREGATCVWEYHERDIRKPVENKVPVEKAEEDNKEEEKAESQTEE